MRRGNVILISVLVILAIIFGLQYAHRVFGVNTGILTIPEEWLVKIGFPTDSERWVATQPSPTLDPTPEPVPTVPPMGAIMTVPITISTGAVTETASQSAERKQFLERLALIEQIQPAGVTLFGTAVSMVDAQKAIAAVKRVAPSTLIMVDHEGGSVQRLNGAGFTALPSLREQCALDSEALQTLIASSAAELRMANVDVILAPVVDRAAGGFMGNRTCSSSPEENSDVAQIYISEMARFNIGVVLKHFPGIGGVTRDLHVSAATAAITREDTASFYLLQQFNGQALPIMVSFVVASDIEGQSLVRDELPCALSPSCVGLLTQGYPDVLLISDALEMEGAKAVPPDFAEELRTTLSASPSAESSKVELSLVERSIAAMEAGINLLLYGPTVSNEELREVASGLETRYKSVGAAPGMTLPMRYNEAVQKIAKWNEARHAR